MREDFRKDYQFFIDKWGIDAQMLMAVEEMSELTKELCKLNRFKDNNEKSKEIINNIKEEIADVINMAEQLEYYFGEQDIEKIRKEKIERTLKRIEGGK